MIGIQLPESTIEHVEVLVWEVCADFVDVFLCRNLMKRLEEIWILEISESDVPIIIGVKSVENAHDNCICVAFLKFWGLL